MIRCEECQKKIDAIYVEAKWGNWLKLMHYFEHELYENEITDGTFKEMTDALMSFKPWVEIREEGK